MAKLERLITPKGVKTISENGEFDVAEKEKVFVDVEGKVEIPQVSNLVIDEDGILTFDLPDYSELEQYNPTISYIININDNVFEVNGNSASVKEYANEGENNVVVTTKVAINGLGKDGVVEYVPSEEGKYTIFTLNLTDETLLQPTIIIYGFKGTYTIDWGDGNVETYTSTSSTSNIVCKKTTAYGTIGIYTIKVLVEYTEKYNNRRFIGFTNDAIGSYNSYTKFICDCEFQEGVFNKIPINAFHSSQISKITIPNGITTIENGAFGSCPNLAYFDIPNGITTIENGAFYNSSYTKNATILLPSTITKLGSGIFKTWYGEEIEKIVIKAIVPPTISSQAMVRDATGGFTFKTKIVVPAESLEAYKSATNWINYTNIVADTEE